LKYWVNDAINKVKACFNISIILNYMSGSNTPLLYYYTVAAG